MTYKHKWKVKHPMVITLLCPSLARYRSSLKLRPSPSQKATRSLSPLSSPHPTAQKPRCSPRTGRRTALRASLSASGLRSEHSSPPRSALAGPRMQRRRDISENRCPCTTQARRSTSWGGRARQLGRCRGDRAGITAGTGGALVASLGVGCLSFSSLRGSQIWGFFGTPCETRFRLLLRCRL